MAPVACLKPAQSCGYPPCGRQVATDGNAMTTAAAAGNKRTGKKGSLNAGLTVAFATGAVMGFAVVVSTSPPAPPLTHLLHHLHPPHPHQPQSSTSDESTATPTTQGLGLTGVSICYMVLSNIFTTTTTSGSAAG